MDWHKRIKAWWVKPAGAASPPIPDNVEHWYGRIPLYGRFNDAFNVFGPYRRPILDATGGGTLNDRQLYPLSSQDSWQQRVTPVSITGDGAELTGNFGQLPLVNTQQETTTITKDANGNVVITSAVINPGIL